MWKYDKVRECELFEKIVSEHSSDGNPFYVGTLLKRAASRYFKDCALVECDRRISYGELYFRAMQLSRTLKAKGVKARDCVVLFCENSVEFYVFYFAVLQCGAVLVPVNTFLGSGELVHIINDCHPSVILSSLKLLPKIENDEIKGECSIFPEVISECAIDWKGKSPTDMSELPADSTVVLSPDEVCVILYTSGTTGKAKGVMLSSRNVMTNAMQVFARLRALSCDRERFFAVLPLFHVFAQNTCIWIPLLSGSSVIIVPKIDRRAIREGLKHRPTIFLGFPALYGLLCLMRNAAINCVKIFVSGADAMPDKIRAAFGMIYGRAIYSGYGLTEASPVVAVSVGDATQKTESVGSLLCGVKSEVRNSSGAVCVPGEVGSLWVSGDNVMLGYYSDKSHTNDAIKDGWLDTGDLAQISESGVVDIVGREKDLIIHKGLNIYPQEIENVLLLHPLVFRVAVVGEENGMHGQTPVAFVVLKNKSDRIKQTLKRFCLRKLAAYKVPRKFWCVKDLPLGATGKVDKKLLKRSQVVF